MQIINDPGLISGLGTGLGETLSNLVNQKVQQMQQQKGLAALGFPIEATGMDPRLLAEFLKNQPRQNQLSMMQQILGGAEQQQTQPFQQEQLPADQMQPQAQELQQIQTEQQPTAETVSPKMTTKGEIKRLEQAAMVAPADIRGDLLKLAKSKKEELRETERIAREEKKMSREDVKAAFKETKDFRKETLQKSAGAKERLTDLSRMKELLSSKKLDTPGYYEFLKRSGLDMPALMNPESQEFQKIAQTFMRDVKEYVGGNVSNVELEQFMKTIPSLSQSPRGMRLVIANLDRFYKLGAEKGAVMKNIIKKNNGRPPLDLMERVDDKMDKRRDRVIREFREDLKKAQEIPESTQQERVRSFGQAVGGSILGAPGKILGGIGKILGGL